MSSEALKRLNELRKNLDKKSKKVPDYHISSNKDYHISSNKDYHIHRKVTTDDIKTSYRGHNKKEKETKPKNIATIKIKTQIEDLFKYGFSLQTKTKISVSADKHKKYETFRFRDKFQIAALLSEYSKGANMIIFMVDVKNDSIIWNNYGSNEIRVYTVYTL